MENHKELTVINLFGGPGTGKSTTAAGLFFEMKHDYYLVELVNEYAKELLWKSKDSYFKSQDYIFAKQHDKLTHLAGKTKYAITDSPLPLNIAYTPAGYPESFEPFVWEVFNSYNNINIFLVRKKKYVNVGRNQSEEQARDLDNIVRSLLDVNGIPYYVIEADKDAPKNIVSLLKSIGYIPGN
jgi:hypothetical protein